MMDRIQSMQVFVRVADVGGFAEAARQMHLSPPAVTRAVAALEVVVGSRLFVRTTRSLKLTDTGVRYLEDCRRILSDIAEADATAAGIYGTPSGTLTVTASAMFGQLYILPILTDYLDTYPDVTGRALFVDRVTNIVDEGIDVSIRIGDLPDSSHSAVKVGTVRRALCGSPAYFERRGRPAAPSDLGDHRIVAATSAWNSLDWRFGSAGQTHVTVKPSLFCNTNLAARDAAVSGWGLTRLLSYQVAAELENGSLETVLNDFELSPVPIHIVHLEGRRASAKVRAFVDLAVTKLRQNPYFN
jgi:DNA-binding transcriptional LysR family regulator